MSTPFHSKYYAHELTKRCSSDSLEKLSQSLNNATIDYSLEIKNLPMKPEDEKAAPPAGPKPRSKSERRDQALLFDLSGAEGGAR